MIYAKIENKSDCIGGGIPWRIRGNHIDYAYIGKLQLPCYYVFVPPWNHLKATKHTHKLTIKAARP